MIYYTSDLHFWHERAITFCNRPFKSVEEMNNTLIQNWNNRVTKDDIVYFLGDFGITKNLNDVNKVLQCMKRLKGRKVWIQGNHDARLIKNPEACSLFEDISIYKKIVDEGREVILMHYPIECWERMNYGSYHVHGHIHNRVVTNISNRFNAGVDVNKYKPVTLKELIENSLVNKIANGIIK